MTEPACPCANEPLPSDVGRFRCRQCGRIAGKVPGHRCHARGCETEVPPKLFMCSAHWKRVPRDLQKRVWREYRVGQEIRKDPSEAYLRATTAAIEAVAAKERAK